MFFVLLFFIAVLVHTVEKLLFIRAFDFVFNTLTYMLDIKPNSKILHFFIYWIGLFRT